MRIVDHFLLRVYKKRGPDYSGPLIGGDYLLSHFRSTIGVVRLNFSVRNGKRWNPHAITTFVSSVIAHARATRKAESEHRRERQAHALARQAADEISLELTSYAVLCIA